MATMIHVTADPVWSDPAIDGLEVSESEWCLNVERYQNFITDAAGVELTDGIAASDCYRIGNRLQALIEEHKRNDEWAPVLVDEYPDIGSLEEFLWVARFFQTCYECNDPQEICFSPDDPDEARVSRT